MSNIIKIPFPFTLMWWGLQRKIKSGKNKRQKPNKMGHTYSLHNSEQGATKLTVKLKSGYQSYNAFLLNHFHSCLSCTSYFALSIVLHGILHNQLTIYHHLCLPFFVPEIPITTHVSLFFPQVYVISKYFNCSTFKIIMNNL